MHQVRFKEQALLNAFISKIFFTKVPVLFVNICVELYSSVSAIASKVAYIDGKLLESVNCMFFLSGNPGFQTVWFILCSVGPNQVIGHFLPVLYAHTAMT